MAKTKTPPPTCPSQGCGKKLIRCKVLQPRDPNYGRSYDICSKCNLRFWLDEEAFNVLRDVNSPPPPPSSLPLPRGVDVARRGSMSRAQSVPPTQPPRAAFAPPPHSSANGLVRQPLNSLGLGRNHSSPGFGMGGGGGRQRHSSAGAGSAGMGHAQQNALMSRSVTPYGGGGGRGPPTPTSLPFGGSRSPTPSGVHGGGFGAFSPPGSVHGGTRPPTPMGSEYGGGPGAGGYFASQPVTPTSSSHPSLMSRPGTPSGRSTPVTSSRASSMDRSGMDRSGIYDNEEDAANAAEIYREDGPDDGGIGDSGELPLPPPEGFDAGDGGGPPFPEPQLTDEPQGFIDDGAAISYDEGGGVPEDYGLGPGGMEGENGDITPRPGMLDPGASPTNQSRYPSPTRSVAMRSPTPSMRQPYGHPQQQYHQGGFQSPPPGAMGMRSPTPSMMSPLRGHSANGYQRPPPGPHPGRNGNGYGPPSHSNFRAPASAPPQRRSSISTIVAPRISSAPTWQPGQSNRLRSNSAAQQGGATKSRGVGLGWFGQIRSASPAAAAAPTRSFTQPPPRQSYAKTWTAASRAGSAQPAVVLGSGTKPGGGLARRMSVGAKSYRWGDSGELIKESPAFRGGDPGMHPPARGATPVMMGGGEPYDDGFEGGPPPGEYDPGMMEPGMEDYVEPMEGEGYDPNMEPFDGQEPPMGEWPPEEEEGLHPGGPLPA